MIKPIDHDIIPNYRENSCFITNYFYKHFEIMLLYAQFFLLIVIKENFSTNI